MKTRVLIAVLFLLSGVARASLKVVTDQDDGALAAHSEAKATKKVGVEASARKLQRRGANVLPRRQRRPANRRPNQPRPQRGPAPAVRMVPDSTLVDIHERSLRSPFLDPRAANVRQRPGTECDLYVELEPMFYTLITRTAATTMHFSSNCLNQRTTLNVESVFGTNRNINWAYHPTTFYLNILGNLYEVEYSNARVIDRRDILRSLRYSRANIRGTFNPPSNIRLGSQNSIYLAPHVANSLTAAGLRRFRNLRGHWSCVARPRRFTLYQNRLRQRRADIARLRKQGFSTREIAQMINGKQYGPRASQTSNIETPREVVGLGTTRRPPRRRRTRRRATQRRRPRPRKLEVSQTDKSQNEQGDAQQQSDVNDPQRNLQGNSIMGRVQSAVSQHVGPAGILGGNPRTGTRNRRRGRRPRGRRAPRGPRAVSRYELEETRQRNADRQFILDRLRRNFVWELVTVCTLR